MCESTAGTVIRRRFQAVILTYHRVADGRDPLLQCVSPACFQRQICALADSFAVVPLCDAVTGRSGERCVSVTFDDGYADVATVAAPILSAFGVPATLFAVTPQAGRLPEFWWDELEHVLLDAPSGPSWIDVAIDGRQLSVHIDSTDGRLRALKALNRRLRVLPPDRIRHTLDEVRGQLGTASSTECTHHARLTLDALSRLAANPLIDIGSHGTTHAMLGVLDDGAQQWEIELSRDRLTDATGRAPSCFAYPYGTPESISPSTSRTVARAGFRLACMNTAGVVTRRTDSYRIPRMMVYEWDGEELVARIKSTFERGSA
jgi:peptidoglycan/xylan/chitin deacetylase (PgdA/CDA1 family)